MKKTGKSFLLRWVLPGLLFLAGTQSGKTQQRVLIDGKFDEWNTQNLIISDRTGDNGSANVDFRRIWMDEDDDFLFFSMELGNEINLQEQNSIELFIDTDQNIATGILAGGIGADLLYHFGNRSGILYRNGNSNSVNHAAIGMVSAPTVSSERFEFSISKSIISGNKISVFLRTGNGSGDSVGDNGGFEYTLKFNTPGLLPAYSLPKKDTGHLRIMTYNVLRDGIFSPSKSDNFRKIFKTLKPDIIGFQEIYDASAPDLCALMESFLPSSPGQRWYCEKVTPDIFLVSRYPIVSANAIRGSSSSSAGNGQFLVDLSAKGFDLIQLLVAHLPCCENDLQRQGEVDAIMGAVRASRFDLPEKTPLVIMGDMNFVGSGRQLQTFLTGDIEAENVHGPDFSPDWDFTNLEDAEPYNTGWPFTFTWNSPGSSFAPGKLDFIIYSGSVMEKTNAFVLNTAQLPQNLLAQNGLNGTEVSNASDHAPVVADFNILKISGNSDLSADLSPLIYPNPASDFIFLETENLKDKNDFTFQILSQDGRVLSAGLAPTGSAKINIEDLPSGYYLLRLISGGRTRTTKFVKAAF